MFPVNEAPHTLDRLWCNVGLCRAMQLSKAKQYLAYARECLEMAEKADTPEQREKLIELSRAWMQALEQEMSGHEQHRSPSLKTT